MPHLSLPELYRNDFPSLERQRNGKPPVYMDNACTTLVPRQVIDSINEYYSVYPACGGRRSNHWFANEVTERIEGARQSVADFIHAESSAEIIFTLNTTHAINVIALGFGFKPGDVVILSDWEHNSNLLPWLRLQKAGLIRVEHTPIAEGHTIDLDAFEERLKDGTVRLVSMAFTSNATGVTLPAREIINIAHRYGAMVLLDGAQTVPHRSVDVHTLDVDFLAFSIHKMCGPRGVGVLYGKREVVENLLEPVMLGGGTVGDSSYDSYRLLGAPERFEAGIQNYAGLIASGAAVQYLKRIGTERIAGHEHSLNAYLTEGMMRRYGDTGWFHILGPGDAEKRGGILTFEVRRPNAPGIAGDLSMKNNIMIRDGVFCVHSYFNERFGPDWTRPKFHRDHRMVYRISLYFYNTLEECDLLLETLEDIFRERGYL